MMWRVSLLCCAVAGAQLADGAWAQNPASGGGWRTNTGSGYRGGGGWNQSVPEVYGPTGRRYGPTQAAYQYQLQYGRPWNGGQGLQYVNGFPGGGGGHGGYGGFSPIIAPYFDFPLGGAQPYFNYFPSNAYYGTVPPPPPVLPNGPLNPTWPVNPQLQPIPSEAQINSPPLNAGNMGSLPAPTPIIEPSTPAAQQQSLQLQAQGDQQLQQLSYLAASERYRRAIDAARDRVEPRYRLAVTLLGRGRYLEAADQLKLVLAINPHWPKQAESFDQVLGHQNALEKLRIQQRVSEWVRQDVRDPNRLFLLAVVMYLEGDPQFKIPVDSAIQIAGPEPHLVALQIPPRGPADIQPLAAQPTPHHPHQQPTQQHPIQQPAPQAQPQGMPQQMIPVPPPQSPTGTPPGANPVLPPLPPPPEFQKPKLEPAQPAGQQVSTPAPSEAPNATEPEPTPAGPPPAKPAAPSKPLSPPAADAAKEDLPGPILPPRT
ncbi:hypothetical protein [Planctomicrobium sp. SH664]|uniref:hypothetical protein n=1 Tax=Planctomicrobium sp. SH664 TaxID=3448125 RepID=UPI003F5C1F15